ncbi:MAG: hypothetical protein HY720_21390 [Planctomycetes bacterium]|nr:hypothetical protein [Planctomycetota bacterium]
MSTPPAITREEFEAALTPEALRPLQILPGALAAGVLTFAMAVGVLFAQGSGAAEIPEGALQTLLTLSLANVLLTTSAAAMAVLLPGLMVRPGLVPMDSQERAALCLGRIRSAIIVRFAVLEGPALYGWVVCLVAQRNGVLSTDPRFWLNALSTLPFVAGVVLGFPTRERLKGIFETRILGGAGLS